MTTYPINYPTSPVPAAIRMIPRAAVALSEATFTGDVQKQVWPRQWWEVDMDYDPPADSSAAASLRAFLLRMNGAEGTCLFRPFRRQTNLGSLSLRVPFTTPVVNGSGQTGDALATDGWTLSATGVLLRGDYIQLGTGLSARIYEVLDDVNADGSGLATINVWPKVQRSTPVDQDPIYVSSPVGAFRLASAPELNTSGPMIEPFTIGLTEDLVS